MESAQSRAQDITWLYRKVLDEVLASPDGAILDRYILEWEELKRRWVTKLGKRDRRRVLNSQLGKTLYLIEGV